MYISSRTQGDGGTVSPYGTTAHYVANNHTHGAKRLIDGGVRPVTQWRAAALRGSGGLKVSNLLAHLTSSRQAAPARE